MSSSENPAPAIAARRHYTLDDVIALNDEIIALVRSGVPLERGLLDARGDLKGRLRQMVEVLAERTGRGESLDQAIASGELNSPEVYSAIVRAGVRGGRLAVALEQLSVTARRIADLRRIVVMAAMYPLVVAFVGCSLFAAVAPQWAQVMELAQEKQRVEVGLLAQFGLNLAQTVGPVAIWLPSVLLLVFMLWWFLMGRARSAQPAAHARWLRCIPGLHRLVGYSCAATFCEVLALLIENDVPLPEALPLAGATSGDAKLQADARLLADKIRAGERVAAGDRTLHRIPALIRWMLSAGETQGRSVAAIRSAADDYHHRARHLLEWLQLGVPIVMMLLVGVSIVSIFAFTVFVPWSDFIDGVAESIGRM